MFKLTNKPAPSLGREAQAFMGALEQRLPDEVTAKEFRIALADTLRSRRFRTQSTGFRSLAEAAFAQTGTDGIRHYLREQASLPLDASEAKKARRTLGPALQASLRKGQRELDDVDTTEAFALAHGLDLLEGTIRGTYEAPAVPNHEDWSDSIRTGLREVTGPNESVDELADRVTAKLDTWQRTRSPPTFKAILASFTNSATLARRTYQFMEAVRDGIDEHPTEAEFSAAVERTLKLRRFRAYEPGLLALSQAAWAEQGSDGIDCYLRQQSEIAFDADVRDGWNRDVRAKLGPILSTVVRASKKELTTADTVQAFALAHGVEMLEATIEDRYRPPEVEDIAKWKAEVTAKLEADLKKLDPSEPTLDLSKVDRLTSDLTASFDRWTAMSEPEQRTLMAKLQTLATDLAEQPREVLIESLKDAAWKLDKAPTEAHLLTITATSMAILAKVGIGVVGAPMLLGAVALALSGLAIVGGQFAADLQGGIFHHRHDNYPGGRTSKAFIDHHYDPRAVSTWSLIRNTHGTARGMTPLILAAAMIPAGPASGIAAAFLVSFINGLLYTQHVHGKAHAVPENLAPLERFLQSMPIVPVMLPPHEHIQHHSKPIGKEVYGVLNGWSNALADKTGFYRGIEAVRHYLTGEEPGWKDELRLREEAKVRKKAGRRPVNSC